MRIRCFASLINKTGMLGHTDWGDLMVLLSTIFAYKKVQFALRMLLYVIIGTLVLFFRFKNRKKTRKRMDERTEYMMKHTKKNKDGKYPWEE